MMGSQLAWAQYQQFLLKLVLAQALRGEAITAYARGCEPVVPRNATCLAVYHHYVPSLILP